MKKILFYIMLMAASISIAAANDDIFFIGTSKNESNTYSDSTPVNVGEKYALVWTTNGVDFAGFNSDGTLVDSINSKLIIMLPANKNGRLGLTMVQIAKGAFGKGTFSLSLLDTRTKNPLTGEYEFNEDDVSNVREYFVLASGYEYKEQFERMELTNIDMSNRYVANGYVEPETVVNPSTNSPVVQDGTSTNENNNICQVEDWTHQSQNTNVFNVVNVGYVELTNFVTQTIWHDATRYTDMTNYFFVTNNIVMTNVVDLTNTIVNTMNATNLIDVTRYIDVTNIIDKIVWHDVTRYFDVTNYFCITNEFATTNTVDLTNMVVNTINETNTIDVAKYVYVTNTIYDTQTNYETVYKYITITNFHDSIFGKTKRSIPTSTTGRKSTYTTLVMLNGNEVGTSTIQVGKPNLYGLVKINVKMKIGKKTYTDTMYGMIDDDGCVLAYGKELNDRLVFNGKDVEGFVQYKGTIYEIDGVFTK